MKNRVTRPASLWLALSLLVCLLGAGCAQDKALPTSAEAAAPVAIDVQTTRPVRGALRRETEFMGRIESGSSVNVFSEITAKILTAQFNVGEFVNKGDLLMEVDDTNLQTALEGAKTSLESAELTYAQSVKQMEITTEGSAYIKGQMSNAKSLSDLLDNYYDAMRSQGQLNSAMDEYCYSAWEATSAKTKAQTAWKSYVASDGAFKVNCATIYNDERPTFESSGITEPDLEGYITGEISPEVSVRISLILQNNLLLSTKVANLQREYNGQKSALAGATTAEATAQAALEAYEKTYDNSSTTIDTTIRTITKNYDYYSQVFAVSDTLGREETNALNDISRSLLKLSIESAQRNVQNARDNLEKCKIYAPVSGVITAKNAVESNYATASAPMYVIASDEATPVVSFNVSEAGAEALYVGASVTVTIGGADYPATVTEISNAASATSGLYPAKAAISGGAEVKRTGGVIKVRAATAEAADALILPLDLIDYEGNQPYVYVYDNGTAVRKDLTLGMTTGAEAEIRGGLLESDEVITTWHPDLKDGAPVARKAADTSPASTASVEVIE